MQLIQVVKSVLGDSFGNRKKDFLIVFFVVNNEGKVLEVEYLLQVASAISMSKLADLEHLLKQTLRFKAKDDSLNKLSFVRFGMATTKVGSGN